MEREHIPWSGTRWVTVFSRPPLRTSWNNASGSPARSSYPFTDLLALIGCKPFFVSWYLFLPTTRSHKHNRANWQCQLETAICQNTNTFCKYWKSINIYVPNIWKVTIFISISMFKFHWRCAPGFHMIYLNILNIPHVIFDKYQHIYSTEGARPASTWWAATRRWRLTRSVWEQTSLAWTTSWTGWVS